jgi:urate oxidase
VFRPSWTLVLSDLAKVSPHVLIPERFALHLGTHVLSKYQHLHKAFVTVEQLRWSHIPIDGREHPHSFMRDGDEKRVVNVEIDATKGKDKMVGKVTAGVSDLLGAL